VLDRVHRWRHRVDICAEQLRRIVQLQQREARRLAAELEQAQQARRAVLVPG
jgi:hypothetical protein